MRPHVHTSCIRKYKYLIQINEHRANVIRTIDAENMKKYKSPIAECREHNAAMTEDVENNIKFTSWYLLSVFRVETENKTDGQPDRQTEQMLSL